MGLFGPSRGEIWNQLSDAIGGSFTPGSFFQTDRVDASVDNWIITLDSIVENKAPYTRLRAPFRNPSGLRFSVQRAGIFTAIGVALGMQDIEVEDNEFDSQFVLSGNDESAVRSIFRETEIQQLLQNQPNIQLTIRDNEGWFGPSFPDDTDELYFLSYGTITDIDQLKSLFDLFAAVLHKLSEQDNADSLNAGITL